MGEGFGRWKMGPDEDLMPLIDRANIACGFHAGDPTIMLRTIRLARTHSVLCGAHPGLQDLLGFGRRKMEIDPHDMYCMILYQVGALKAMLEAEGVELAHIKPHGELYFYMQRDEGIMRAVLKAAKTFGVPVLGAKGKRQAEICAEIGVEFIEELYVDIDWDKQHNLVPVAKSHPATPEGIKKKVTMCSETGKTIDIDGDDLDMGFQGKPFTICLHSDMPTALQNVKAAREAVDAANAKLYPVD
ncbi:hypothetical protein YB2330_003927 [Saitoella coloradoensis]